MTTNTAFDCLDAVWSQQSALATFVVISGEQKGDFFTIQGDEGQSERDWYEQAYSNDEYEDSSLHLLIVVTR